VTAAAARFVVTPDHPALPGHFPGLPVVPGVVVLDHVVEAAERLVGGRSLRGLPQAKFPSSLAPGVEAEIALEPRGDEVRFVVTAAGTTIAQGVLAFGAPA